MTRTLRNPEAKPWERLEGESPIAFKYFGVYRDLGPDRSVRRVGKIVDKAPQGLSEYARKWDWVRRATAWDARRDQARLGAQMEETEAVARRQARQAAKMIEALLAPAEELLRRLQNGKDNPLADWTAAELLTFVLRIGRAMPELFTAERLARGEPAPGDNARLGPTLELHQHEHLLIEGMTNDPGLADAAAALFGRLTDVGAGDAGGPGLPRQP